MAPAVSETYRTRVSGGTCSVCSTPLLAGQRIAIWVDRYRQIHYAHADCAEGADRG